MLPLVLLRLTLKSLVELVPNVSERTVRLSMRAMVKLLVVTVLKKRSSSAAQVGTTPPTQLEVATGLALLLPSQVQVAAEA